MKTGLDKVEEQVRIAGGGNGSAGTPGGGNGSAAPTCPNPGLSAQDLIRFAYAGQKGCAELFRSLNKGRFCFDHAGQRWYEFREHYWEIETLGETLRALNEIQDLFRRAEAEIDGEIVLIGNERKQLDSAEDASKLDVLKARLNTLEQQRKVIAGIINNLNNLQFRKQVVEFSAQGVDSLGVSGDDWDIHPWSLAAKNGVIDLRTGEIRDGLPHDYIKSYCPTVYAPEATCPMFESFLLEILDGNRDVAVFIQRLFGAAIIGESTQKQIIAILSGAGRNGKDTLIGVIGHVLGPHLCSPIPAELLLESGSNSRRSSQGPSADLMKLRGLRLAYCNETSQGRRFNAGVAKQLSGGGKMTAREPYGRRNVDWEQTHMLILMTNHRPHAPIDDFAFWKRIKNVHFPLAFVTEPTVSNERRADPRIAEKLKAEAPGILRWLVEGCLNYQQYGLTEPAAVREASAEYLREEDLTGLFIEECCTVCPGAEVSTKALYAAYKSWTQENNHRAISGTAFGRYVGARFERGRTGKIRFYSGIGLFDDDC